MIWGAPWLVPAGPPRAAVVHVAHEDDLAAIRRVVDLPVLALVPARAGWVLRAVELGATGVLPVDASASEISAAIDELAAGRPVLPPFAAGLLVAAVRDREAARRGFALTARERQVLAVLVDGRTTRGIATVLGIGFGTVQTHLKNLYRKLGVGSKAAATAVALRHQLV